MYSENSLWFDISQTEDIVASSRKSENRKSDNLEIKNNT